MSDNGSYSLEFFKIIDGIIIQPLRGWDKCHSNTLDFIRGYSYLTPCRVSLVHMSVGVQYADSH